MDLKRILIRGSLALGALALLIQFVPYGRGHSNPPIAGEPAWDSARTRELARRACFDCHSNETRWPFYAHVAPVSWLVQRDVDEGRAVLNVSEWTRPQEEAAESADTVRAGEMPMQAYAWLHPGARLDAAEREALVAGLTATFGSATEGKSDGESDDDDGDG